MKYYIVLENLIKNREVQLNRDRLSDSLFTFQDSTKSKNDKIRILKALPSISFLRVLNNLLFWHNVYVYPDHPDYQALKQSTYLDEFRLILQTDRPITIDLPTSFQVLKQQYEATDTVFDNVFDKRGISLPDINDLVKSYL